LAESLTAQEISKIFQASKNDFKKTLSSTAARLSSDYVDASGKKGVFPNFSSL